MGYLYTSLLVNVISEDTFIYNLAFMSCMKVLTFLEKISEDKDFKAWQESHDTSYLVHVFFNEDEQTKPIWQAGYYNTDDTITSFSYVDNKLEIIQDESVFKKDDNKILTLSLEDISIDYDDALETAIAKQKESYGGHDPVKIISVLQHLQTGQVYNFTMITQTFQTLNVKLHSNTKKIIEHKLYSLMDLGEIQPGEKDK
mgnify:FL=1